MTSGPLTQLRNKLLYYNHFCFCACTDVTAGNRDMRFLANRFFLLLLFSQLFSRYPDELNH